MPFSANGVFLFRSTPHPDIWMDQLHDPLFFFTCFGSSSAPHDDPWNHRAMRHSSSEPGLRSDLKSTLEFNTLLVFGHLYVCHSRRQLVFFVNSWSKRKITTSWQSGPGPMPRPLPTEKFSACSSRHVRSHYCDFLSFALLLQRAHVHAHTC